MNEKSRSAAQQVNVRAIFVLVGVCLLGIGLIAILDRGEGPATRCEARGGYYMVGPAGETSCIDRATFLPMIDADRDAVSR